MISKECSNNNALKLFPTKPQKIPRTQQHHEIEQIFSYKKYFPTSSPLLDTNKS